MVFCISLTFGSEKNTCATKKAEAQTITIKPKYHAHIFRFHIPIAAAINKTPRTLPRNIKGLCGLLTWWIAIGIDTKFIIPNIAIITAAALIMVNRLNLNSCSGSGKKLPPPPLHKNIVCSRAGPTDAIVSFAPVSSAMALRYALAFGGNFFHSRASCVGVFQPGNSA